ncbi:Transcriptional regulator [hydrothermal vent metagenome]|uniref:Transcriptional regulator n=1 Tax=hydrothermal vent metagenome TaxID=652676 RepID=A0A1W1E8Y8_9ZZZZ
MRERIFIVEDEVIVAIEIKRTIEKLGFLFAGMASNDTDALRAVPEVMPDLILMDIMLKKSRNGIEINRELRKAYRIPVIYLTSVTDTVMMQEAVETEPVGYLLKPFRREELHSTILLGLYKASAKECSRPELLNLGYGYFYDTAEEMLFFRKEYIPLGKKEGKLLKILIDAEGSVIPFHVIESLIWDGALISESALRTLLYRINNKLDHKLIETVPGYGCRLITPPTNHPKP